VTHFNGTDKVCIKKKQLKMGVTKEILREGDGANYPKKGNKLSMHYSGTLASDGSKVRLMATKRNAAFILKLTLPSFPV
jgi:FKBP-type peptidyl-prolyl cis-trans isomerase